MLTRNRVLAILTGTLVLLAWPGSHAGAASKWRDLTGRMAPDLVFSETGGGLTPGTRLASYRGKKVVLLAFWLRDCPHCKRALPKVQDLHSRYRRSGLQVISIVHNKYPLSRVTSVMRQRGWTFPVVRDTKGQMGVRYGNGRRPGFYIIGIDGRVRASSTLSPRILTAELSRWRLHELGAVPDVLARARAQVGSVDYGAALRLAEAEGNKAGASSAVRVAVAKLKEIAGRKLQNRVDRAEEWYRAGLVEKARTEYDGIRNTFRGTSLASRAEARRREFIAKAGAPKR